MIRRVCVAVAAMLLLVAWPSGAAAKGGTSDSELRFAFESHSGYRVHVFATRAYVAIRVDAREGPGYADAFTTYFTRGHFDGDRFSADFGDLGKVSMRFVPSSSALSGRCEDGRRFLARHGKFVGSLRFPGEGDYLGVDAQKASGVALAPLPGQNCNYAEALGGARPRAKPKHKLTYLYAGFREGLDAVYFRAYKEAAHPYYEAIDESGGEHIAIYHYAYVEASPLTFATDSALSFASVSPPYPFGGTGSIQRNPDGSRVWSGSLTVSFPGDPGVGLTGPEFKTELLREW